MQISVRVAYVRFNCYIKKEKTEVLHEWALKCSSKLQSDKCPSVAELGIIILSSPMNYTRRERTTSLGKTEVPAYSILQPGTMVSVGRCHTLSGVSEIKRQDLPCMSHSSSDDFLEHYQRKLLSQYILQERNRLSHSDRINRQKLKGETEISL